MDVLRPAVLDIVPMQRPDILGPNADRFVFCARRAQLVRRVLPVRVEGGVALLDGAASSEWPRATPTGSWARGATPANPRSRPSSTGWSRGGPGSCSTAPIGRARPREPRAHPIEVALGRRPVAVVRTDHPDRQQVLDALRSWPRPSGRPHGRGHDHRPARRRRRGRARHRGRTAAAGTEGSVVGSLSLVAHDLRTLARATHVRELALSS